MAATTTAPSNKWLQGPVSDVVLGGGLLYIPILLLLFAAGPNPRESMPFLLVPLLLLIGGNAHVGATLLRLYERPEDRRAYSFFTIYVTIAIAILCSTSFFVPGMGSFIITFYLTIVPWHFTGQNYGVALVLLHRQGVEIDAGTKRVIHLAFVLPFVLWILALHGAEPAAVEYAPLSASGTHFQFISVGIPAMIQGPAVMITILAYLWVLGECFLRMRRIGTARQLLPGVTVFLSQGLWFTAPVVAKVLVAPENLGPFAPSAASFTFIWISLIHGVQYLWMTAYYVKKERPGTKTVPFLARSLLMGTALYGIPVVLLAPALAGRVTFDGGLQLMLAAALNIHHIVLDSAIWKLRNARIAKILIRGADASAPVTARRRVPWIRAAVLASGVVGVVFTLWGEAERRYGIQVASARGDVERMETAVRRMRWMGRDNPHTRTQLGFMLGERGDEAGALAEFERSIALEPNATAWTNIGALRERSGDIEAALVAYDSALALDPDDVAALHYAGRVLLLTGRPERARPLLERAASLAPDRIDIRDMLEEAARS
jgi:hypothetical protein